MSDNLPVLANDPAVAALFEEYGHSLSVGEIMLDSSSGTVYRITSFSVYQHKDREGNLGKKVPYVHYEQWKGGDEWGKASYWGSGGRALHEVLHALKTSSGYTGALSLTRLGLAPQEIYEHADRALAGEEMDFESPEITESQATALAFRRGKREIKAIRDEIALRAARAAAIEVAIKKRIESITYGIHDQIAKLNAQVNYLNKALYVGNLYLGTGEKIEEIATGERAGPEHPLAIMQLVLYMDEEFGDPAPHPATGLPGMDWQTVGDFYRWVRKPENFTRLLPFPKCIVAIRPARQDREYTEVKDFASAMFNDEQNAKNEKAYLLIRNGDNLWGISTDVKIGATLFMTLQESRILSGEEPEQRGEYGMTIGPSRRKLEEGQFQYKAVAALLQGILDRTDLFQPLPVARLDLFDVEASEGYLRLVRDAENVLATGLEPWSAWHKRAGLALEAGSRIYYAGGVSRYKDYYESYFPSWSNNSLNYPDPPDPGIYIVEEAYTTKYNEKKVRFLYLPGDEIYERGSWRSRKRKRRVSFLMHITEKLIVNYDAITLSDLRQRIDSRYERKDFLGYWRLLWGVYHARLDELAYEQPFVDLVAQRTGAPLSLIWETLDWWKIKNKWKRTLDVDEAKALRMIEREIAHRLESQSEAERRFYDELLAAADYRKELTS